MFSEFRSATVLAAVMLMAWVGAANAATQPMIGEWVVINPSVGGTQTISGGPARVGNALPPLIRDSGR